MSLSDFFPTLRSSDHDFIAAIRFFDDYAKQIYERGRHHQAYHHFVPRFDLEQHGDSYELYGELPGFRREEIIIEAHDNHNLQVSGSISCLTPPPPTPSDFERPKDVADSTTKPQDQKLSKEVSNGEESRRTQESASGAKAPPPKLDPREATTSQERYLNARFGDVLNPHPVYANEQEDSEASPEDGADAVPKVRYLISERHPRAFHRAFHFPTPIKKDEVTATMQDGILHIAAPRAPMPLPVKVPVKNDLPVRKDLGYYPAVVV
jgi:HSP20 family molecular chaperone IbpA